MESEVVGKENEQMNSAETSESDVTMESSVSIGPELPPGFDLGDGKEEEKKDSEKEPENEPTKSEETASTDEPKTEKIEEQKESEKKEETKSEESTETSDPGMVSNALNGAKSAAGTLLSSIFGAGNKNAAFKKQMPSAPADGIYDDEEVSKAEEYKVAGNDHFQSKSNHLV